MGELNYKNNLRWCVTSSVDGVSPQAIADCLRNLAKWWENRGEKITIDNPMIHTKMIDNNVVLCIEFPLGSQ